MCFSPSPPKDNSAEIARQQEAEREANITKGRESIDQQFSQFDDPYYQGVQNAYSGFYLPQLSDQFENARKQLIFGLSRNGNLNGSAGASTLGDLQTTFENNKAMIGDQAISAADKARADVQSNRDALYSQLDASADPTAAANSAIAQVAQLSQPASYSPLGNIFAQFLNMGANGITAQANGLPGFQIPGIKPPSDFTPSKSATRNIT